MCFLEPAKKEANHLPQKKPSSTEITEAIRQLESGVEGLTAKLHSRLREYVEVISLRNGDLGRTSGVRHKIDTQGASPVRQSARRLPFHQRNEVRQMLDQMLQQGVIKPAHGPWSSPIVLVKKKDDSTRFALTSGN